MSKRSSELLTDGTVAAPKGESVTKVLIDADGVKKWASRVLCGDSSAKLI